MLPRSNTMIVWTPIAVNEKSLLRGKKRLLPEYSAAVIGSSVVLRLFAGGFTGLSFALTTVPFATPDDARAWSRRTERTWLTRASSPTAIEPNALPHGPMVCRLRLHLHPVDGSPARVQHGVWAGPVPNETGKISMPYPSGGTNDVLARIVGDKLQAKWGQPVIIENRSGGSGNIGAA